MSIVATLLDKARSRKNISSDNALAQHLGTNRQVISQWRHGDSYPSEDNIAELAEMAGDDPVQWLVAIKAVRADGKAGKAWAALAKRLAAAAMVLFLAVGFTLPQRTEASVGSGSNLDHSIHYAKCRNGPSGGVRRLPLALDQALNRLLLPYSFSQQDEIAA